MLRVLVEVNKKVKKVLMVFLFSKKVKYTKNKNHVVRKEFLAGIVIKNPNLKGA